MNKAFLFLLFALQCCLAQQPDLFFWLELRGTRAQVEAQLAPYRSRWTWKEASNGWQRRTELVILPDDVDTVTLAFTRDTLSGITLQFREQGQIHETGPFGAYCIKAGYQPVDQYQSAHEYRLSTVHGIFAEDETACIAEERAYLRLIRRKQWNGIHTTLKWRDAHFLVPCEGW